MLKITIIAMGNKMPDWVVKASLEYNKRLQENSSTTLIELPLQKRTKSSDIPRIINKETEQMLAAIPHGAHVIALEITGKTFSSESLATHIEKLKNHHSHLCFLLGGPEGLGQAAQAQTDEKWSLSPLTLTHPLARIVLFESLYRSFCILNKHPYHK